MNLASSKEKRFTLKQILIFGPLPLAIYFACFFLLTYPAITGFGNHLFSSAGDSYLYLWNFWHVQRSLVDHVSPFYTHMLFYPGGTTLLPDLGLTNSLPGALLSFLVTPYQSYNLVITFNVVSSGLSAFLLAYYFSRSYLPSLLAGFIYAFSGFEAVQLGQGHINMTSLQWMPLFILCWYAFLNRPDWRLALASSIFLVLNVYSSLYYFIYVSIAGLVFLAFFLARKGAGFYLKRGALTAFVVFLAFFAATAGPFLLSLARANASDPFLGSHSDLVYSAGMLDPFVPGVLTGPLEGSVPFNEGPAETDIGLIVIGVIWYGVINKKNLRRGSEFTVWLALLAGGFIFSLGPALHFGNEVINVPMPYSLATAVLPALKMGGMPDRIISMVILSAAVLAAITMARILKTRRGPLVFLLLTILIVGVDFYPIWRSGWNDVDDAQMKATIPKIPGYVNALKDLHDGWAVFDYFSTVHPQAPSSFKSTNYSDVVLFQTIHGHPMFSGYIARVPAGVQQRSDLTRQAFEKGDYDFLCGQDFKYVAVPAGMVIPNARLKYSDLDYRLYDLTGYSKSCRERLSGPAPRILN